MTRAILPPRGAHVTTPNNELGTIVSLNSRNYPIQAEVRLSSARQWFDIANLKPHLPINRLVEIVDGRDDTQDVGYVTASRVLAGFTQILVQIVETGESRWVDWRMLRPINSVEALMVNRRTGRFEDHAERVRLRILARALKIWNANTGAFGRLDIDPLPHQIDVARKVVTSHTARWLIADDVGLGKTIEVGLILNALAQRNRCRRVLIVCPASLTTQWKQEMRDRFKRPCEIYKRDFSPEHVDELKLRDNVIVSLDVAKMDQHTAMLLAVGKWDAIIFDEAHRLGRGASGEITLRHNLARQLHKHTDAFLMLTATPHQGKTAHFASLLELVRPDLKREIRTLSLNPEIVGDIIIRNRKSRVTHADGKLIFHGHDTIRHKSPMTPQVVEVKSALDRYLRQGYNASSNARDQTIGRAIGFVMTTYRKLASSSLAAIERALERRLVRLKLQGETAGPIFMSEDELEGNDELENVATISSVGAFFEDEMDQVQAVLDLIRKAFPHDSKVDTFVHDVLIPLLDKGENLLVFTEYRATQSYLLSKIAEARPGLVAVQINGSMSLDEKGASVRDFNNRHARVLISTEAGGEGLNLQQSCHVMVNYDLPWNPARLVQRIGRLYRYGQNRRVQVINMLSDDGFDNAALVLMIDKVTAMARDMAAVNGENREALEADILGEIMSNLDMESILERSTSMKFSQTEEDINAALRAAQLAREAEVDILEHAFSQTTSVSGGFEPRHMVSFVKGMAEHAGITIAGELHNGRTLELVLPEDTVGRWPEFGRRSRVRLTVDHAISDADPTVVLMDFESRFVCDLAQLSDDRHEFDGLYGETGEVGDELLTVHQIRWQGLTGNILQEDLLPLVTNQYASKEMDREDFAELLLHPLTSNCAPTASKADGALNEKMQSALEETLKRRSTFEIMPSLNHTAAALRFR